jgi:transcriptional regulator GlxA family with amidase domain
MREAAGLGGIRRISFLTLPNYSMIALASALEGFRMANYVAGRAVYSWDIATPDGAAVPASNGLTLAPTGKAGPADLVMVCGGVDVRRAVARTTLALLRRLARKGGAIGALCTGTFALAEAGLLDGFRAAIHWENLAAIREEFPAVAFVDDAFAIDRDRLTCTGGVAPLEMTLALIAAALGDTAAAAVADQFMIRWVAPERQRAHGTPVAAARVPAVAKAIETMRQNLEAPLPLPAVAAAAGLSQRQLERLFQRSVAASPGEFYLRLRLDKARELLRQSPLPVTDVALACGFQSASHFSVAYGRRYGHPPRRERAA